MQNNKTDSEESKSADSDADDTVSKAEKLPKEVGGRGGLDPTRYGDWEKSGRCIDF